MTESMFHAMLMIADGYESHELGPKVKTALQIKEWVPTDNPKISISAKRQDIIITKKTYDQGIN